MSRGMDQALLTLLSALKLPRIVLLFEFHDNDLRLTNWPRDIDHGGKTYTGTTTTANKFNIKAEGLGENLGYEAPTAVVQIDSVNAWAQGKFFRDEFREDRCTITLLYISGNSFLSSGWETTYRCDAEEIDANKVRIRLGSLDAVTGTESPRRTTQSEGCQWHFQQSDEDGGCTFRWMVNYHSPALRTCDRTYDGPNGCRAHFPDVVDPVTGQTVSRMKPYGGFLGSVDHRLVRVGG